MADLSIEKLIEQYVGADLIIIYELGFTPLNNVVADHIFRIVSERYERGAIIVTSNKPFELCGEMFPIRSSQLPYSTGSFTTPTSSRSAERITGPAIVGLRRSNPRWQR